MGLHANRVYGGSLTLIYSSTIQRKSIFVI